MILGEYLQMKYGTQKKKQLIMQREINLRVKYRESFRPFAPVILEDKKSEWFDINTESPYMLIVSSVNNKKLLLDSKTRLEDYIRRLEETIRLAD